MEERSTIDELLAVFVVSSGWYPDVLRRERHGLQLELREHPEGWYMARLCAEWRADTGEALDVASSYRVPGALLRCVMSPVYAPSIDDEKSPDTMARLLLEAAESKREWRAVLAWVRVMAAGKWAGMVGHG